MKKLIAIFFLSVYLFSTTQLSELVKLPVLIEHFIEHKQADSKLSFWGFLMMHYAHGDVKDADYEKDMKLPFKSVLTSFNAMASFYSPAPVFELTPRIVYTECKQCLLPYTFLYSSGYLSSIWQPPKSC